MIKKIAYKPLLVLSLLVIITLGIYFPALSGGYIFDDIYSLSLLKHLNNDLSIENLVYYFAHSDTGPLKRPISVFSFLIDAQNWPADPYSFKRTNLIIHLINGVLLFSLLVTILKAHSGTKSNYLVAAFFATAFWMLHPFLLSTTMYIVQRMAMLPVMFILAGLLFYVKGRINYQQKPSKKSLLLMFVSVYLMTLLAMLSKENGVLLLAFIALTEVFVIKKFLGFNKLEVKWQWLLIRLPVIALLCAVIIQVPKFISGYDIREFTLYERLLSEPRALFKYLYHLFIPQYMTEGVFTDGFKKSTGLFEPFTTVLSLMGMLVLITAAWLLRNRWPLFSFAVFFFLVAHSLESSFVPLELYFEHRNYSAFLFVPLFWVLWLVQRVEKSQLAYFILSALLVFSSFQTFLRAQLWGDNFVMHYQTMEQYPESKRARVITAIFFDHWKSTDMAVDLIKEGIKKHDDLELKAVLTNMKCDNGTLVDEDIEYLVASIATARINKEFIEPLGSVVFKLLEGTCGKEKRLQYLKLINKTLSKALKDHKTIGKGLLFYSNGRIFLEEKSYKAAVKSFNDSFQVENNYSAHYHAIAAFLQANQPELALKLIDFALSIYDEKFKFKIDWFNHKTELLRYRKLALQDRTTNK